MHKNNFIVSLKSNGKILRERDDYIYLPFGSEYSILFKNLDSRKAQIKISIDGKDVLNGYRLIAIPNNDFELEGFLEANSVNNKFKFIKKTEEISDYRGDRIDDGLIRVEFTFEKEIKSSINYNYSYTYYNPTYGRRSSDYLIRDFNNSGVMYSSNTVSDSNNQSPNICYGYCSSFSDSPISKLMNIQKDEGITVKGSQTNQKFEYGNLGELEETPNVIILKLKGSTNGNVSIPLTVKTKLVCTSCGRSYNSSVKYCSNCGTFLELK